MEASDWRTQLSPQLRGKIVNKVMHSLKVYVTSSGKLALSDIEKIALKFEEKIYTQATNKEEYIRKIAFKLQAVDRVQQNTASNSFSSNSFCSGKISLDPAFHGIQSQADKQGQVPGTQSINQSEAHHQHPSSNIENDLASAAVQGSVTLSSSGPPASGLIQASRLNGVGENSNLQNISVVSLKSVGKMVVQGLPSNISTNYQMHAQGSEHSKHVGMPHNQQRSLISWEDSCQLQIQPQLLKQFKQENLTHSQQGQPQLQQQREQKLPQPTQMQSSPQRAMQTSFMTSEIQSSPRSDLSQNHQSSDKHSTHFVLKKNTQTVPRQPQNHQNLSPMPEKTLPSKQQQKFMGQRLSSTTVQQNPLLGQQNSVPDLQQHNKFQNLQRQLQRQQSNHSSTHQEQLCQGINVPGVQQCQKLLGTQCGNSCMQQSQFGILHQCQQTASGSSSSQVKWSQPQQPEQQLMSQSQPEELQQPPSPLQQHVQQRIPTSGILNLTSDERRADNGDWQEGVYQKAETLRSKYLTELKGLFLQMTGRLQQQPKTSHAEKLKEHRKFVDFAIMMLNFPKSKISPAYEEKLGLLEKQIRCILYSYRTSKPVTSLPQGQLSSNVHSVQQSLQPQSETPQMQPPVDQQKPHLQCMNLQSLVTNMHQKDVTGLHDDSMSSVSEPSMQQQKMMSLHQPVSTADSEPGNSGKSQYVAMGSLQIPKCIPQQPIANASSRSCVNLPQPNLNPCQMSSDMLQRMHPKQKKEQQNVPVQNPKGQFQHHQRWQLTMQHNQQIPKKQQEPATPCAHEMPQRQINEVNDLKVRQGTGVKSRFLQLQSAGQRLVFHDQHLKSGVSLPASSPQLLRSASPHKPQGPQFSSPLMDQQNLLISLTKTGTPSHSENSPSIVHTSTLLAQSPVPGYSEKLVPDVSSLSNAGNVGHQQTTDALELATPFVIDTHEIPPSPLLAEFDNLKDVHCNASTIIFGDSNVSEQPLQCLLRMVNIMSQKTLSDSVRDIESVVSMAERLAGPALDYGSIATGGEDLEATTEFHLPEKYVTKCDDIFGMRKMKRCRSEMPFNIFSVAGDMNEDTEKSDLESTAVSRAKRFRIEANLALLDEIREINQQLIDTVVDISDEDANSTAAATECCKGTIVKCSFNAVTISSNLKSQQPSTLMSPIQPLWLLVPTNYPYCSPILLNKLPTEVSEEHKDLSSKAKSKLSMSLRTLLQPMSLAEIAMTWDSCVRAVISEYAQQNGGGNFSSKYGYWENCFSGA